MINNIGYFNGVAYIANDTKVMDKNDVQITFKHKKKFTDFTNIFNKMFVAHEEETVKVIDNVTGVFRDTTAETSAGYPLKARCVLGHKGRMYAANLTQADGVWPARLRWSGADNPENFEPFGAGNYLGFQDIGDPQEPILRMKAYENNIVVFKEHSVWLVSGDMTDPVSGAYSPEFVNVISPSVGIIGSMAVTDTAQNIYFMDRGGFYRLKKTAYGLPVLDKIYDNGLWSHLENRDKDRWDRVCMCRHDPSRKTIVIVPAIGYGTECFVKTENENWSKWEFEDRNMSAAANIPGIDEPVFGDFYDGAYVPKRDKRVDFASGKFISSVFDTGWIDPSRSKMMLRSLQIMVREEGEYILTCSVYKDMCLTPSQVSSISLSPEPEEKSVEFINMIARTLDLDGSCQKVRFRFQTNAYYGRFKIQQLKIGYKPGTGI